jgi:hypothetical protein
MTLRIFTCYKKLSYVIPTITAHSDAVIGQLFLDLYSIVSVARDGSCFLGYDIERYVETFAKSLL